MGQAFGGVLSRAEYSSSAIDVSTIDSACTDSLTGLHVLETQVYAKQVQTFVVIPCSAQYQGSLFSALTFTLGIISHLYII